ncbi:hypothetical protein Pint_30463 [Pistacia integerrima]|uniref:Uncharacterized protein n=1 Tax=Pistacia integerrima TaxID=434235 RepID=A0ACC0X1W3_9ROSI|nr:hypothetical protein Pint_30463 [Pistacia integerrima]
MDDMAKWSAARLKPNFYDFKVEVFNLEYEILNVDPDEYSYICFIKDVKRCVASENEVVEINPYEKFKVEVELPLSGARYIVEGDDDMEFIFEQYKSFGKRVIRVSVEAIPVDFVEPRTLLEAQPEDNEGFVRQDNEEAEEDIPDEFYWSVESDESDHEEDHESGQDGQGSGVVEGMETGQESGVVKGIEIGQGSGGVEENQTGQGSDGVEGNQTRQGSGGVEGNQTGQGSGGVEDIEVQGEMSEYHEDSLYEGSTDDEDAVTRFSKHMKGQQFAYGDNGKIHFKVGQVFEGVDHFRKVFRDYVIQMGFSVRKIHNERRRFKAKCKQTNCPFHLYATLMPDDVSFQIRKYRHSHTCTRVYNNREATTAWVAEKMGDFIRSQKGSSIKPLVDALGRKHYLQLSRSKLYRANQLPKGRSDKLHVESFTSLLKYDHIVKHTNPAQKKGFIEGCRHFIGVDGCHLKGPYDGVLLSAVFMDANSGIFPVAITICEIENKESWRYFMTLLKEFIGDIDPITIMSDRQKGLGANIIDFQQAMEKVEAVDREAHRWMIENDVRSWSRHAFDLDSKSDHVTNNMCEVFNSWLGENKELPILSLLEHYRRRVMVQMQARAKARNDWVTTVPPVVHRKINGLIESARNIEAIWPGSDEFEVVDNNCLPSRRYILNLQSQTCDYGMWQLSGVPCVHAVRCLLFRNIRNMEDYVDSSLRITSYVKTYADHIHPIPDPLSWPDLLGGRQLNPPIKHSKVGRPKKARKKDADEEPRMTKGATLREEKLHQPQQVRHVNIEATVKGSEYLRSVELKHVVVFGCVKTVEA